MDLENAKRILEEVSIKKEVSEKILQIIKNHHNKEAVDTIEFKILWDADNLVNLKDKIIGKSKDEIKNIVFNTFFTEEAKK